MNPRVQAFREAMAAISREIEWSGRDDLGPLYADLAEASVGLITEAERVGGLLDVLQTTLLQLGAAREHVDACTAAIERLGGKHAPE